VHSPFLRSFLRVSFPLLLGFGFLVGSISALGQETGLLPDAPQPSHPQTPPSNPEQNGPQREPSQNDIFWVIPHCRSDEDTTRILPSTRSAKMKVAFDDSFDPSAFLAAGILAGLGTAQRHYASFGQGAQRFGNIMGGIRRSSHREHHEPRTFPGCAPSGPSLFCERKRPLLETNRLGLKPRIHNPRRGWPQPLQHVGARGKRGSGRDFQLLLPGR